MRFSLASLLLIVLFVTGLKSGQVKIHSDHANQIEAHHSHDHDLTSHHDAHHSSKHKKENPQGDCTHIHFHSGLVVTLLQKQDPEKDLAVLLSLVHIHFSYIDLHPQFVENSLYRPPIS